MKTLLIILFPFMLYAQWDIPAAAIYGTTSGMSEGYRIKEQYGSNLTPAQKKALNVSWHNWNWVARASGIGVGYTIYLDAKNDWIGGLFDALNDAVIFNITHDGAYNTIQDRPFFHQSKQTGWVGEAYLTAPLKIFLALTTTAFRLMWKYVWKN